MSSRSRIVAAALMVTVLAGFAGFLLIPTVQPNPQIDKKGKVTVPVDAKTPDVLATDLSTLSPDRVAILEMAVAKLTALEDWQCTNFRQSAWERAGKWVAKYLEDPRNLSLFAADPFMCLPSEDKRHLVELQEELKTNKPGKLQRSTAETVFVLRFAATDLKEKAREWTKLGKSPSEQACRDTIVQALQRYERYQKQLARVQWLAQQPDSVTNALNVDREVLRNVSGDLDILEMPSTEKLNVLAKWDLAISKGLQLLAAPLKKSNEVHRQLAQLQYIDLPATAAAEKKPFLRCRLMSPEDGAMKAADTRWRVRLGLVLPLVCGKVSTEAVSESDKSERKKITEDAFEEISLGVEVSGAKITFTDGKPVGMVVDSTGIRTKISVFDPRQFQSALERFGVPRFLVATAPAADIGITFDFLDLTTNILLPGAKFTMPLHLRFDWKEMTPISSPWELHRAIRTKAGTPFLADLQQKAAPLFQKLQLSTPLGAFQLSNLRATGDWSKREFSFAAEIAVPQVGTWTVPFEFSLAGDPQAVRILPHAPPYAALKNWLLGIRDRAIAQLRPALPEKLRTDDAMQRLGKIVRFDSVRFDVESFSFSTTLAVKDPFNLVQGEFLLPLQASLSDPYKSDLKTEGLQKLAVELLTAYVNQGAAHLQEDIAKALPGKSVSALGGTLTITQAKRLDGSDNKFAYELTATIQVAGQTFQIRGIRLTNLAKLSATEIEGPTIDFSHTSLEPGLADYLQKKWNLDASLVQIRNERALPGGFAFDVAVRVAQLDNMEVPVGTFTLGKEGPKFEFGNVFEKAAEQALAKWLRDQNTLAIKSVGPLENLRAVELGFSDRKLKLALEGELRLIESVRLKMKVRVSPDFKVFAPEVGDVVNQVLGHFKSLNFGPIAIPKVSPSLDPLGITFDAKVTLWVFGAELNGISITRDGVRMPEMVSLRLNNVMVPIPPVFAIANPGISFSTRDPRKFGLLGDLTFTVPQLDKILKINARITAFVDTDNADFKFELKGELVLVSVLRLMEVNGVGSLRAGRFELESRTTGILDQILQIRGRLEVNAFEFTFKQKASLGVLGLTLADTEIVLNAHPLHPEKSFVSAKGIVAIPLVTVDFGFRCSMDFQKDMQAWARFEVGVGNFTLAGASLKVTLSRARLTATVVGLKLTAIVPSVADLSPDLILRLIKKMLTPSFGWPTGEVVVNLVDDDPSGNRDDDDSLGNGDPLPGSHRQNQNNNSSNEEKKSSNGGSQPPGGGSTAPAGGAPADSGRTAVGGGESQASHYLPGDFYFSFHHLGGDMWTELHKNKEGQVAHGGWYEFTTAVKNQLSGHLNSGGSLIVSWSNWPLLNPNGTPASAMVNRNKQSSSWGDVCLTLNQAGQFHVVEFNPTAHPNNVRAVDLRMAELGFGNGADLYRQLTSYRNSNPKDRTNDPLKSGDINLFWDIARSQVVQKEPKIGGVKKIKAERKDVPKNSLLPEIDGFLERDEGYLFRRDLSSSLPDVCFLPRKEFSGLHLWPGTPTYTALKESSVDELADLNTMSGKTMLFLADICRRGGWVELDRQPQQILFQVHRSVLKQEKVEVKDRRSIEVKRYLLAIDQIKWYSAPVQLHGLANHFNLRDQVPQVIKAKLTESLFDGWQECWVGQDEGQPRLLLGKGMDSANWQIRLIAEDTNLRDKSKTIFDLTRSEGKKIEDQFARWVDQSSNIVSAKAPHQNLKVPAARRWLALMLTADRASWSQYFEANPRGLLFAGQ